MMSLDWFESLSNGMKLCLLWKICCVLSTEKIVVYYILFLSLSWFFLYFFFSHWKEENQPQTNQTNKQQNKSKQTKLSTYLLYETFWKLFVILQLIDYWMRNQVKIFFLFLSVSKKIIGVIIIILKFLFIIWCNEHYKCYEFYSLNELKVKNKFMKLIEYTEMDFFLILKEKTTINSAAITLGNFFFLFFITSIGCN